MNKTLLTVTLIIAGLTALPSIASAGWFSCTPNEVLEVDNRIHVRCSNSVVLDGNTIRYIAIAKTDESKAARFISLGTSALLSGKIFQVYIPTASSTNVSGCAATDCRTPTSFGVK